MALARAYQTAEAEYAQALAEYETWAEISPVCKKAYPLYAKHGARTEWNDLFQTSWGRKTQLKAFSAKLSQRRTAARKRLISAIGKLQTLTKRIYVPLLNDFEKRRRKLPVVCIKWHFIGADEAVRVKPLEHRRLGVSNGSYTVKGFKNFKMFDYHKNYREGRVINPGMTQYLYPQRAANMRDFLDMTPMRPTVHPDFPTPFASYQGARYLTVPKDCFYWNAGNRNLALSVLFTIDKRADPKTKKREIRTRALPMDMCRIIVAMVRGNWTI